MVQYTAEQLPKDTNNVFIAYGPETRLADPLTNKPITMRPQTYIAYYRNITISKVGEGRSEGVTRIEFDPTSVGLKEPIGANLDSDDPLVEYLTGKMQASQPVDVAIEVMRKVKHSDTKEAISPFAHIHAVRQAEQPNGARAPQQNKTIRKMLVMVDGQPGKALTSNPAEWAQLTANREGNLPPEGWSYYQPGDDWRMACIIPDEEARSTGSTGTNTSGGPAFNMDELGDVLAKVINHVLDQRESAGIAKGAHNFGGKVTEGTVYELRTGDGQINLGSFCASGLAEVVRRSHGFLAASNGGQVPTDDDAWRLAELICPIVDKVQADSYRQGGKLTVERRNRSWNEAFKWVAHAIETTYTFPGFDNPSEWQGQVYTAARANMVRVGESLNAHYAAKKPQNSQAQPQQDAQPQQEQATQPQQQPQEASAPQGDADGVELALSVVEQAWNNVDELREAHAEAKELGALGAIVSLSIAGDGTPTLSHPAKQGEQSGPLAELIAYRGKTLAQQGSQSQGQQASDPQPQEDSQPQGQAQNSAPSPAVIAVMKRINDSVTNLTQLREVYEAAKSNGALTQKIAASVNGVTVVPDSSVAPQPVSDILNTIRQAYENREGQGASNGAPQAPTAQQLADEAAGTQDKAHLQDIRDRAVKAGVAEETVRVGGGSGALRAYLDSRI